MTFLCNIKETCRLNFVYCIVDVNDSDFKLSLQALSPEIFPIKSWKVIRRMFSSTLHNFITRRHLLYYHAIW